MIRRGYGMGKLVAGATAQRKVIRIPYCLQMAGCHKGFAYRSAAWDLELAHIGVHDRLAQAAMQYHDKKTIR
jgi:hypothetical protein